MIKAADYKAIYYWHKFSGSLDGYIQAVQRLAEEDKAPADALFYRGANPRQWVCVSDLAENHDFRVWYEKNHA